MSHRMPTTDPSVKDRNQEEESNAVPEVSVKVIKGISLTVLY